MRRTTHQWLASLRNIKEKARQENYPEIRLLFDEYVKEDTLQDKKRDQRAGIDARDGEGDEFHDEKCVKQTPIRK